MRVNLMNGGVMYTDVSLALINKNDCYFVLFGERDFPEEITKEEFERLRHILYPIEKEKAYNFKDYMEELNSIKWK